MRTLAAAGVASAALVLAACSGTAPAAHVAAHRPAKTLTYSQGARICNDLNAWLTRAANEDRPRFTAQMQSDELAAGTTNLGLDLGTLDANLQQLNGAAFSTSPPGYSPPTGMGALQRDCAAYGVNVQPPGSTAGRGPSCAQRLHRWIHDQGQAPLHRVHGDAVAIGSDASKAAAALRSGTKATGPLAKWQAAATALGNDTAAAAANPPPACADAADYDAAMQDYGTAARNYLSFLSNLSSGSYGTAKTLINTANAAIQRGTRTLRRYTATITAMNH